MWFSSQISGLIGGLLGCALGLWGAALGIVAGKNAAQGKRRGFVLNGMKGSIVVGVLLLAVALVALLTGQPYHVWYPPLLLGGIMTFLFAFLYPGMLRQYQRAEAQKMAIVDAMESARR